MGNNIQKDIEDLIDKGQLEVSNPKTIIGSGNAKVVQDDDGGITFSC